MSKSLLYALCIIFVFSLVSCEKDNLHESGLIAPQLPVETIKVNPLIGRTKKSKTVTGLDIGCFTIKYPLGLVDEDGNVHNVVSEEDFENIAESELLIDFEYPITISLSENKDKEVNNENELSEAFASCVPLDEWEDVLPAYNIGFENSCFTLIYPTTLTNLDESGIVVNSDEEFNSLVSSDIHFFQFPVSVLDQEENVMQIESEDDLLSALFSCNDWEYSDSLDFVFEGELDVFACFNVQFPVSFIDGDSTVHIANGQDELDKHIFLGDFKDFVFPIQYTAEDGSISEAKDGDDLAELFNSCFIELEFEFDLSALVALSKETNFTEETCYDLVFPIIGVNVFEQEDTVTVNSPAEIENLMDLYEVIYPFEIILTGDTKTTLISDSEIFNSVLDDCN